MEARRKLSEEPAAKTPSSQEQITYFRSLVSGPHPKQTESIQLKSKNPWVCLGPHGWSRPTQRSTPSSCPLESREESQKASPGSP